MWQNTLLEQFVFTAEHILAGALRLGAKGLVKSKRLVFNGQQCHIIRSAASFSAPGQLI